MKIQHIINVINATYDLYKLDNIRFIISSTPEFDNVQKEHIYKTIDAQYDKLSNDAMAICSEVKADEIGLE